MVYYIEGDKEFDERKILAGLRRALAADEITDAGEIARVVVAGRVNEIDGPLDNAIFKVIILFKRLDGACFLFIRDFAYTFLKELENA